MSALPGHHPPGVNQSGVNQSGVNQSGVNQSGVRLGTCARTLASNNQVLHRLQLIAQRIHHPLGS